MFFFSSFPVVPRFIFFSWSSIKDSNSFFTSYCLTDMLFVGIQIEGEANKSGRGPSVWDIFAHESPGICVYE